MYEQYGKSGKKGKAPGFSNATGGKNENTEFYESQLTFAKDEEAERMDQYGKPGTSAKARQSDPYETSFPTSRYRSRRP